MRREELIGCGTGSRWLDAIAGKRASRVGPLMGILPGEGVGPEVIAAALKVLDAVETSRPQRLSRRFGPPIGLAAHPEGALTPPVADFCASIFDAGGALLCGPGGGRFVYDLRHRFDLFCKIAPLQPFECLLGAARVKPAVLRGVDILLVRDNAGGVYQGSWTRREEPGDGAVAEHHFSYRQTDVRRIVEAGARLARQRRGRIDVVIKDAGVPTISQLWRDEAAAAAHRYGIEYACLNADYAAYQLIQHPSAFDVLVTPNMLGDILADLGAVLLSSRGLSFSGNFSPEGCAAYQTGHGAARDLAGADRANPAGQILSLAMMLRESYDMAAEAALIETALQDVWRDGWRTDDLAEPGGRHAGTREMGERVAGAVLSRAQTQAVA